MKRIPLLRPDAPIPQLSIGHRHDVHVRVSALGLPDPGLPRLQCQNTVVPPITMDIKTVGNRVPQSLLIQLQSHGLVKMEIARCRISCENEMVVFDLCVKYSTSTQVLAYAIEALDLSLSSESMPAYLPHEYQMAPFCVSASLFEDDMVKRMVRDLGTSVRVNGPFVVSCLIPLEAPRSPDILPRRKKLRMCCQVKSWEEFRFRNKLVMFNLSYLADIESLKNKPARAATFHWTFPQQQWDRLSEQHAKKWWAAAVRNPKYSRFQTEFKFAQTEDTIREKHYTMVAPIQLSGESPLLGEMLGCAVLTTQQTNIKRAWRAFVLVGCKAGIMYAWDVCNNQKVNLPWLKLLRQDHLRFVGF